MYLELDCGFVSTSKTENLNHFTNLSTTILPQFHNFWHNVEPQFPTKGTGVCDRPVTKSALPFIFRLNILTQNMV